MPPDESKYFKKIKVEKNVVRLLRKVKIFKIQVIDLMCDIND
jgi:hypothetical protein